MDLTADDHVRIAHLYAKYRIALDSFDGVMLRQCFSDGGILIPGAGPRKGQVMQGEQLATFGADTNRPKGLLWNTEPYLMVSDGCVLSTCYALSLSISDEQVSVRAATVMKDEIVCNNGEWLFRSRRAVERPNEN